MAAADDEVDAGAAETAGVAVGDGAREAWQAERNMVRMAI